MRNLKFNVSKAILAVLIAFFFIQIVLEILDIYVSKKSPDKRIFSSQGSKEKLMLNPQ